MRDDGLPELRGGVAGAFELCRKCVLGSDLPAEDVAIEERGDAVRVVRIGQDGPVHSRIEEHESVHVLDGVHVEWESLPPPPEEDPPQRGHASPVDVLVVPLRFPGLNERDLRDRTRLLGHRASLRSVTAGRYPL